MNLPRCWLCSYLLFVCSRSLSTFSINRKTLTQHPPCTHAYTHTKPFHTHTHTYRCALICLIKLHSDRAFNHSQFSNHSLAHSRAKQTNVNTDAVPTMCEWQCVCVCVPWLEVELHKPTHKSTLTLTNTHTHTLHRFQYLYRAHTSRTSHVAVDAGVGVELFSFSCKCKSCVQFVCVGNALMQNAALLSTQKVHGNKEHKVQHTFQIKQKIILWDKH